MVEKEAEEEAEDNQAPHPNAREPVNGSTRILEAEVLQHQTARREDAVIDKHIISGNASNTYDCHWAHGRLAFHFDF